MILFLSSKQKQLNGHYIYGNEAILLCLRCDDFCISEQNGALLSKNYSLSRPGLTEEYFVNASHRLLEYIAEKDIV